MNAWLNLLQKEFRMTRNSALLSLAILFIGGLWLVFLSYSRSIGIIFAPAAVLLVILLFYPAMYILKSLAWEWKVTPHLWLHCPQPAWMLLMAKLAIAMLQMLVIILITAGLLLLGISINTNPEQLGGISISSSLLPFVVEAGFYAAVFTIAASIYIGSWATLISVANGMAGNILGRFRWLAGIAVFAVATVGFGQLQQTWVYRQITHWGSFNIGMHNLPLVPRTNIAAGHLFAGEILFYFLLTLGLFALSAWLIDHKVEV
jgi:hypothetical protein